MERGGGTKLADVSLLRLKLSPLEIGLITLFPSPQTKAFQDRLGNSVLFDIQLFKYWSSKTTRVREPLATYLYNLRTLTLLNQQRVR